jgi:tRNA A37 threonylcarbamoyladenosine dehydratase
MHERTVKVIGVNCLEKLHNSRIAVFGAGGVGGSCVEALARTGVGAIDVFDGDEFTVSNLNRQILATVDTLGQRKVCVAKNRINAINPYCNVRAFDMFITPDNIGEINFCDYDYVIDAIDNVTAKIEIAKACYCKPQRIPLISCMGAGNKLDPTRFRITDISKSSVCPLAKIMRKKMKELSIALNALWSDEPPVSNARPPGSIGFVPPVAGMIVAGYVITQIGDGL